MIPATVICFGGPAWDRRPLHTSRTVEEMKFAPLIVSLAAATAFLCTAAEPDWPQFRGPDSNPIGSDAKLPSKWSKTENIEWSTPIPGRGWSSPIVTGGKIYLTSVTTDGPSKQPQ